MHNILKHSLTLCAAMFIANSAYSDGNPPLNVPPNSWHYEIAPYAWASAISGDVTVRNRTENFKVNFGQILKHLEFAAQGHLEAGYGPLTLMLDPTYLKVSDKGQVKHIDLKITSKSLLVDAGVFYRFLSKAVTNDQFITMEVLGGARHFGIRNIMDIGDGLLTLSEKTIMNAPIVGGRFKADITPKTMFWVRGDGGGFNVDHVKSTWSATTGLTYAIKPHIQLGIAYRALKINFRKNNEAMDVLMYGPAVGISFHG